MLFGVGMDAAGIVHLFVQEGDDEVALEDMDGEDNLPVVV